jgi:hypothetical protein
MQKQKDIAGSEVGTVSGKVTNYAAVISLPLLLILYI